MIPMAISYRRGIQISKMFKDALSAEALALKHGILVAQTMGYNRIIFSLDCMDVIKMMHEGGNSSGVAAVMLDDCYYLAYDFPRVQFEDSFENQML
jgi:hypothetical protein